MLMNPARWSLWTVVCSKKVRQGATNLLKRRLKVFGCGVLVVVIVMVCLIALLFAPFMYPTLLGISARLRTEDVRNWELPSDTELLDFHVVEIYGAALTHPELCTYMAVFSLVSSLSKIDLADHFSRYELQGYLDIDEIKQSVRNQNRYEIHFSFFSDSAWSYHCDHGVGFVPSTREPGK